MISWVARFCFESLTASFMWFVPNPTWSHACLYVYMYIQFYILSYLEIWNFIFIFSNVGIYIYIYTRYIFPCISLHWYLFLYTYVISSRYYLSTHLCLDPFWAASGSSNELLYMNSLKMKLSVLFGVLQMTVGIILRSQPKGENKIRLFSGNRFSIFCLVRISVCYPSPYQHVAQTSWTL